MKKNARFDYHKEDTKTLDLWKPLVSGAISGFSQTFFIMPFNNISKALYNQRHIGVKFKNELHCLTEVTNKKGIGALWKDTIRYSYGNCVMNMICFSLNEFSKGFLLKKQPKLSYGDHYFCGMISGFGYGIIAGPTQNIRVLMQLKANRDRYSTLTECAYAIGEKYGLRGVLRGTLTT